LPSVKWTTFFPENQNPKWHNVAVKFEPVGDEVTFISLHIDLQLRSMVSYDKLCHGKLSVANTAKSILKFSHFIPEAMVEAEFWWEPSQTKYPQLHCRLTSLQSTESGAMDFLQTECD